MAPAKKKQKLSNGETSATEPIGEHEERPGSSGVQQTLPREGTHQQRRSLFIRSLPANTTSESLTDLFSESYPIKHATAVIDPVTKQCRGYGFVTFADTEDAQRARKEFNGHTLEGRKLRIEIAEPRHRDADGAPGDESGRRTQAKTSQNVPQPSRLIVRNLPWSVKTSDQLSKLFMSYGKVKQAYVPKTRRGLMAGFGFVVLRGRKNAERALEGINGKEVDGRTLAVDWAVGKEVYEDLLQRGPDGIEDEAAEPQKGSSIDNLEDEKSGEGSGDDAAISQDSEAASNASSEDLGGLGDEDVDIQVDGKDEEDFEENEDKSSTLFVRNLPFTCTDEDLEDHFAQFGKTRYARIVMDPATERSKGTGFVCFYQKADADSCLRDAPKQAAQSTATSSKDASSKQVANSILQNQNDDLSGQYTLDGRVLQVSRAVGRSEANRLSEEGAAHRRKRSDDKRRLYLLSEGTISSKSKLWEKLPPTERNMRDASAKQRKALIESNPSLHLSLTRLSVRNIPRTVTSKDLKLLAREAVVGFATDVNAGNRQKLSKEELARGGDEMEAAERARKKAGKGVVKQAKVVFEGASGGKVEESSGAGKSRGYGFIEYYTHRNAIMGLRWLNGHAIGYQVRDEKKGKASKETLEDRKKRLIVEFAIENAQVVMRRKDRELKSRDRGEATKEATVTHAQSGESLSGDKLSRDFDSRKRKRGADSFGEAKRSTSRKTTGEKPKISQRKPEGPQKTPVNEKMARRKQIIGRKRAVHGARKGRKQ